MKNSWNVIDTSNSGRNSEKLFHAALIKGIFESLNAASIEYVVPRDWQSLPRVVGKDLDIIIRASQLRFAIQLIHQVAKLQKCCVIARRADGQGLEVTIVELESYRLDLGVSSNLNLDIRTFISFNTVRYSIFGSTVKIFENELERILVPLNGCCIKVLTPTDEFICLYFQYLYKRELGIDRKVHQHAIRLEQLFNHPAVESWVRQAIGVTDNDELLVHLLQSKKFHAMAKLLIKKRWGWSNIFRLIIWETRAAIIRAKFLIPSFAPIIYFSGPDGSGKTTITNGVMTYLDSLDVPFKSFYSLKIVIRAVTKRLAFIKKIGKSNGSREIASLDDSQDLLFLTEDTRDRDTGTIFWRWRKRMALLVGIVDIWIGAFLMIFIRCRGQVVLVETSPYDIFIKYHMPEFPLIVRFLGPLIPKPTRGFIMKADPQNIYQRRSELTINEITEYYERFSRVLKSCRAEDRYLSLSTNINPADSVAKATESILHFLH